MKLMLYVNYMLLKKKKTGKSTFGRNRAELPRGYKEKSFL